MRLCERSAAGDELKASTSNRLISVVTTWPFLFSLATLILNDVYLKANFAGHLTGKLSDFAGIAVVAFLLLAAFPRRPLVVFCAMALAFLWWKSPASNGFIDAFNAMGWIQIGRTVDYTDMLAFSVFPLCHAALAQFKTTALRWRSWRRLLAIPVVAVTCGALLGTSVMQTRQDYVVRKISTAESLRREEVVEVITSVAARHDLTCKECAQPTVGATYEGAGMDLIYTFVHAGSVSFRITASSSVLFGPSGEAKADVLRKELKAELAARIPGLEYAETLPSKRN